MSFSLLRPLLLGLRVLKRVSFKTLGTIFLFFTSGWKSYFMIFSIVVLGNKELLVTGNAAKILSGIGGKLGAADLTVARNLEKILLGVSGVSYVDALIVLVGALFLVLWYLRTVNLLVNFFGGDDVAPFFSWGVAIVFYGLVVWAVSGRFPLALWDLVLNAGDVWDASRLNPLSNSSSVVNSSFLNQTGNSTNLFK